MSGVHRAAAVLITAAAVAVAAAGAAAPGGAVPLSPGDGDLARFYAQRITWQPCGEQLECASVLVPLDYRKPRKETLTIAVNRRLTAGPEAPSLVFNPGGPGASGVTFVANATSVTTLLNPSTPSVQGTFNIVGFDPRGVGESLPLQCISQQSLDAFTRDNPVAPAQQAARATAERQFGADCFRVGRGLVSNIGTEMVARDLDIIRSALGSQRLDYYGASYGTYIGQVYAHLFPGHVGRMVLDSVESATAGEVEVAEKQAVAFQQGFDHWAQLCSTRKTCPAPAGMAPKAVSAWMTDLIDALAKKPIEVGTHRPFSQGVALTLASDAITQGGVLGPVELDLLIGAIAKQDASILARVQPSAIGTSNAWSANAAVMCYDRPTDGTLADTVEFARSWTRTAPTFGAYYAWFTQKCNTWPVMRGKPIQSVDPVTKAPVMIVASLHDPNTPREWALEAARLFPNNGLLTWQGWGHVSGARLNVCVNDAVGAYLVNGTLPVAGATCPDYDPPPNLPELLAGSGLVGSG